MRLSPQGLPRWGMLERCSRGIWTAARPRSPCSRERRRRSPRSTTVRSRTRASRQSGRRRRASSFRCSWASSRTSRACRTRSSRRATDLVLLRQVPVAVDAAEQVRRLVLEAQGGGERVQGQRDHGDRRVTHLRASATVSVGKAQKMFGTKWKVYKTEHGLEGGAAGEHAEAPERHQGQRRHGRRDARPAPPAAARPRAGRDVADGGTPTRTGTPAFGCVPTTFPAALGSASGLYPNQILTRLRNRAAAGRRAQGPGRAAGDRRRGADAGLGREHVPLVLRRRRGRR